MKRFVLFTVLMAVVGIGSATAQNGEVILGVKAGDNGLFGAFSALSVEANYVVKDNFALRGGVQYNTIKRTAAEVRPQYYHDFDFGRISGEVLFNYTYQSHLNNYSMGCGAVLNTNCIRVAIGYYYRIMTKGVDRLCEPFNIYYELMVRTLPKADKWDLNITLTNSRFFELERHYQPSISIDGWWYPLKKLGLQLGANYKPAGMFHISSDYYQIYANVGVCYRW